MVRLKVLKRFRFWDIFVSIMYYAYVTYRPSLLIGSTDPMIVHKTLAYKNEATRKMSFTDLIELKWREGIGTKKEREQDWDLAVLTVLSSVWRQPFTAMVWDSHADEDDDDERLKAKNNAPEWSYECFVMYYIYNMGMSRPFPYL